MALASHAPNLHMTCDLPGVAGLGNAIPMAAYTAPINIIRTSDLCLVTMFTSVWPNNSFTGRAPVTPNYGRSMGRALVLGMGYTSGKFEMSGAFQSIVDSVVIILISCLA